MPHSEKGKIFEARVAHLFALLGFSVDSDVLIAGRQVDLLLEDRQAPLSRTYIVECKDQANPVGASQYDSFRGRVQTAKQAINPRVRGIFVSSVGFTREVKAQSEFDDIELLTIADLETSLIDFRGYIRNLTRTLRDDPALQHFVEPEAVREPLTTGIPAAALFNEWLADPQVNQLTLLGDYGTGKTTLLKWLAQVLAKRYDEQALQTGARSRVPILVDLRDYFQAVSLKTIVLDLLDSHGIRASYAAFDYLSREGQLVILLDSFDEMASRGNFEATLRNFRELNRAALGRAKLILACRTHYFVNVKELHRYFGTTQRYTKLYSEIALKPNFQIAYLQEFDESRVRRYIDLRCGERAGEVKAFIENTYNLHELSRKPVLLDMIVGSESSVQNDAHTVTPGALYQMFTGIWLSRNDWSTVLDIEGKCELLERLAYEIETRPNERFSYRDLPRLIRSWKQSLDEAALREVEAELRTASFLVWTGEGNYGFSHRSFQEYFLACHLIAEAERGASHAWSERAFRPEIYRFIRDLLPHRKDCVDVLVSWIARSDLGATCRGNAIKSVCVVVNRTTSAALVDVLLSASDQALRHYAATGLGFHPDPLSVETLAKAARGDIDPAVRQNAQIALGRIGTPESSAVLLSMLATGTPLSSLFIREAKTLKNDAVISALIARSGDVIHKKSVLVPFLELFRLRWSAEAEAYCERVVELTSSLRGFAEAFDLLSVPLKRRHLDRAFEFIQASVGTPIAAKIILALRGAAEVGALPVLAKFALSTTSRNAVAALDVLLSDFPQEGRVFALDLVTQRHAHPEVRMKSLDALISQASVQELDHIESAVLSKGRIKLRIHLLVLCRRHQPLRLKDMILRHWDQQPVAVKGRMIEALWLVDPTSAKTLIMQRAMQDSTTGTRVAAARVLGADSSDDSTSALLQHAAEDDSKWVRMQALRSLLKPGRTLPIERLREAMAREHESEVLEVRRGILGW